MPTWLLACPLDQMLYIATDELDATFFDPVLRRHPHTFIWRDFFEEKGGNVLKGMTIPDKYVGMIEQVICACGRVFVGTSHSTFSGFIPRIRGYINAPDKAVYHATEFHKSPMRPENFPDGDVHGFYDEWHELWEGLGD